MSEQQKVPKKVIVQTEALQAMIDYVSKRPFVEVSELIANLLRAVETVQQDSKDDSAKKLKPKK